MGSEARSRLKKYGWLIPVALAVLLKAWLISGPWVPFNSDEAVVALMARHTLQGQWPVFFYGQAYMGSLDATLVAAGFALFGQQVWVIRLVQTLLFAAVVGTTYRLGWRVTGSRLAGWIAALLVAIPTVNVTLYTTASLGGYTEALLIGNLILLLSLRIGNLLQAESQMAPAKPALHLLSLLWSCALWGVLAGLGLWGFGLSLVFSLPGGLYILCHLAERLGWVAWAEQRWAVAVYGSQAVAYKPDAVSPLERSPARKRSQVFLLSLPVLALAILLGAAPWLGYAVQNGFSSLLAELGGGAIAGVEGLTWIGQVFQHLLNLLLLGLLVIFGLRPPWNVTWLVLPLLPFVLMLWMGVLVYAVKRTLRKSPERRALVLLWGVILTLTAAFIVTPFGADPSGRYFVPLVVPLAIFAADLVLSLQGQIGRWAWAIVALVLVYNFGGTWQCVRNFPPGLTTQFDQVTQIDHRYDAMLIEFLRQQGETRGYTNYWVSYPLAFHTQEEIIFVPRLPYHQDLRFTPRDDRYAPYRQAVAEAERVAYITTFNPPLDEALRKNFQAHNITWKEMEIGDYLVYYSLSAPVRPDDLDLGLR